MTGQRISAAARGLIGLAALAGGTAGCALTPLRPADPAIAHVLPALVRIHVVTEEAEGGRMRRQMGAGSGAVISPDGYAVTNHHVAGKARHLKVTLADLQEIDADLVGTDPLADIAVIKLRLDQRKDPKAPVAVAAWGDSDRVKVGDAVFALGCPMALSQSVTEGIVSNTRMIIPGLLAEFLKMDGEPVGSIVRWIGHDAVIYGGNSGGPLVDGAGRIVGINEIGIGSLGGAIPANLARSVAEQLIRTGSVKRSWTGIEAQPRLKGGDALRGVLVAGVLKDSPAEKAGIRAGDVITCFDGTDVDCEVEEQLPAFNRLVMGTPIGKRVEVRVMRGGETLSLPLQTVAREKVLADAKELKAWGLAARDLTPLACLKRERKSPDGVLVDSVRPGKPAASAEPALAEDDVIVAVDDAPIRNLAALQAATAAALKGGKPRKVLVRFERGRNELLTVVELGRDDNTPPPASARKGWLPVATQVLTPSLAEQLGMAGRKGVRVTRVLPRPGGGTLPAPRRRCDRGRGRPGGSRLPAAARRRLSHNDPAVPSRRSGRARCPARGEGGEGRDRAGPHARPGGGAAAARGRAFRVLGAGAIRAGGTRGGGPEGRARGARRPRRDGRLGVAGRAEDERHVAGRERAPDAHNRCPPGGPRSGPGGASPPPPFLRSARRPDPLPGDRADMERLTGRLAPGASAGPGPHAVRRNPHPASSGAEEASMRIRRFPACLAVLASATAAAPAPAEVEAAAEKGRAVLLASQDAIVLVKAVVEIRGGGEMGFVVNGGNENEQSADGVLVDASGLVMLPYSLLDATRLLGRMSFRISGENKDIKLKADISEIRIRLANGSQIPARLVFKDEELGVGFVAPREQLKETDRKAIRPLALDDPAPALKVMDRILAVGRLPESLDFEPCLDLQRVQAVVKKPRTLYAANVSPGMPVFDLDGRLAGFSILHATGGGRHGASPVILPVDEILKLVAQAREALQKDAGDAGK